MSAAAQPTRSQDKPPRRRTDLRFAWDPWTKEQLEISEKTGAVKMDAPYIQFPERYIYPSLMKACTYTAYRLLLILGWELYGYAGKHYIWTDKTENVLAHESGMSPDMVQEAVAELAEKGLIEIKRYGRRNLYRVNEDKFPTEPYPPPKKPAKLEDDIRTAPQDDTSQIIEAKEANKFRRFRKRSFVSRRANRSTMPRWVSTSRELR